MSQRGTASWGRRSRRAAARPESRAKRTLVALGTVVLVITPISWILLHEPQSDQADASVPYVTRDDDTYLEPSNEPVVDTPTPAPDDSPTPTPEQTTGTPTPTPSKTPTPGQTPSTTPTDGPTTTAPTDGPGTTSAPTRPPTTEDPKPSSSPSSTPSTPRTTTPPPPADDGNMEAAEQELFTLVDNARVERGCQPLERDSNLTGGARSEAGDRAESGQLSGTTSSKAAAGGKGMTAKAAFDRLKSDSSGTLFNCGLDELGVGRAEADYCSSKLLGLCVGTSTRVAWVADFK
ncbi:hypothetical protein GCM10009789_08930 [Kribbella sancticallisti]|uniref:Uncharacterized protein n=1 Tax=Kribbella sancticallisti TaxID=460087 RepID=A0ABN2CFR7_9ACTN